MGAVAVFAATGTTAHADLTNQGAAADAFGVDAVTTLVGAPPPPIMVGPLAPSAASQPNGNASSVGNVANCINCVPSVLDITGAINSTSAATLTTAANNCTLAAGFPVNGQISLFAGAITGGSACASTNGTRLLGAVPAVPPATTPGLLGVDAVQTQSVTQSCTAVPIGNAGIVGLSLLGNTIPISTLPVNVGPNTDLSTLLPGLGAVGTLLKTTLTTLGVTIILNEQHYDLNGHGLTVNGIHVILSSPIGGLAAGDIVISHSHSQATCTTGQALPPTTNPGCTAGSTVTPCVTPVITKTDSATSVNPGGTLQYTISVANKAICGNFTIVKDTLPPGFTYSAPPVSGPLGTPTVGSQQGSGRQTVTWTNLSGFAGLPDPVVEVINVAVSSTEATGVTYFNEVDVTSQNCGSVHGSDGGVMVAAFPTAAPTPTPSLINTAAAPGTGSDAGSAAVVIGGGLLGLGGIALVFRSSRRRRTTIG